MLDAQSDGVKEALEWLPQAADAADAVLAALALRIAGVLNDPDAPASALPRLAAELRVVLAEIERLPASPAI
jgi:hypothetical protein